jgi:hypothetical protein
VGRFESFSGRKVSPLLSAEIIAALLGSREVSQEDAARTSFRRRHSQTSARRLSDSAAGTGTPSVNSLTSARRLSDSAPGTGTPSVNSLTSARRLSDSAAGTGTPSVNSLTSARRLSDSAAGTGNVSLRKALDETRAATLEAHVLFESALGLEPGAGSRERGGSPRQGESGEGAEAIRALETNLASWREHDRILMLEDEVRASREGSERYLRESLRFAEETLDSAHDALTQEKRRKGPVLNPAQVRETIRALGTEESWNELLRIHDIADNEATRQAVEDLADRIKSMVAGDVSPESIEALLGNIEFLRREIARALRATHGMLPRGNARELIRTARRVATEVLVGLAATTTTDALGGTLLVPGVVYAALGSMVASSLNQLYQKAAAKLLRVHSAQVRLREYHRRLIRAVYDLASSLSWLARSDPPPPGALETVRNVYFGTVFLVGCVDQMAVAISCPGPGRDRYRGIIFSIRSLLDEVGHFFAGAVIRDIGDIREDLDTQRKLLEDCTDWINTLRDET